MPNPFRIISSAPRQCVHTKFGQNVRNIETNDDDSNKNPEKKTLVESTFYHRDFTHRPRWHRLCKSKAKKYRINESKSMQRDRISIALIEVEARFSESDTHKSNPLWDWVNRKLSNAIYNICHRIYFAALAFIKFSGDGCRIGPNNSINKTLVL